MVLRKSLSAREAGAKVILINGRPKEPGTEGKSFLEVKHLLMERYAIPAKRAISLIGIGMGNPANRTLEAERAIREADVLIGAGRMLEGDRQLWQTEICLLPAHGDPGLRLRSSGV